MTSNDIFRDIAKKVHPDLNGGTVDSNRMMQEAIRNRNDTDALLRLARKWGLKLNGTFDNTKFDSKKFNEKVFEAVVGAIVSYSFFHKRNVKSIKGVITKIRKIKKGKYKGAKEFTIYDFLTQSIWKHKNFSTPRFNVVGMASESELQLGQNMQEDIKENKRRANIQRQIRADNMFMKFGLLKNKTYEYSGMIALVNYRNGAIWREIIRTTAKCVFVHEMGAGKERRINIRSILDVKHKEEKR